MKRGSVHAPIPLHSIVLPSPLPPPTRSLTRSPVAPPEQHVLILLRPVNVLKQRAATFPSSLLLLLLPEMTALRRRGDGGDPMVMQMVPLDARGVREDTDAGTRRLLHVCRGRRVDHLARRMGAGNRENVPHLRSSSVHGDYLTEKNTQNVYVCC